MQAAATRLRGGVLEDGRIAPHRVFRHHPKTPERIVKRRGDAIDAGQRLGAIGVRQKVRLP